MMGKGTVLEVSCFLRVSKALVSRLLHPYTPNPLVFFLAAPELTSVLCIQHKANTLTLRSCSLCGSQAHCTA